MEDWGTGLYFTDQNEWVAWQWASKSDASIAVGARGHAFIKTRLLLSLLIANDGLWWWSAVVSGGQWWSVVVKDGQGWLVTAVLVLGFNL